MPQKLQYLQAYQYNADNDEDFLLFSEFVRGEHLVEKQKSALTKIEIVWNGKEHKVIEAAQDQIGAAAQKDSGDGQADHGIEHQKDIGFVGYFIAFQQMDKRGCLKDHMADDQDGYGDYRSRHAVLKQAVDNGGYEQQTEQKGYGENRIGIALQPYGRKRTVFCFDLQRCCHQNHSL